MVRRSCGSCRLAIRRETRSPAADPAIAVRDVDGGPIVVAEGFPYRVVAVDRDGILDTEHLERRPDVVDVLLEREFGRMHADHHQPLILVLLGPRANIRFRALPVDAGV